MGFFEFSMFSCAVLFYAFHLDGKESVLRFPCLSSWCIVPTIVMWLSLKVQCMCLQCLTVVFPFGLTFLFAATVMTDLYNMRPLLQLIYKCFKEFF